MKVSTRGRYALRIMLDIAENGDHRPISFKEVSERQDISFKYIEQIGGTLARSGFLKSVRGAQGGYNLVRPASEYTVGEILRATEGSIVPVSCLDDFECPRSSDCLTLPLWKRINDAVNEILDSTTLQDLIDEGRGERIITIQLND